jgi:hypothetical protein
LYGWLTLSVPFSLSLSLFAQQYGAGGKFNSGMGTMGAMGQQQQQYMQGAMGQQQQQYPGMGGGMGMGMGMQQSPQAGMGQQYPGMGGGMPPY